MNRFHALLLLPLICSPLIAQSGGDAPSVTIEIVAAPMYRSDAVTYPKLERGASLPYPASALADTIEGAVHLSIGIDADGSVSDVRASNGAEIPSLVTAAVEDIRTLRFRPCMVDGVASATNLEVQVTYTLPATARPKDDRARDTLRSATSDSIEIFPAFVPNAEPPTYSAGHLRSRIEGIEEIHTEGLRGNVMVEVAIDEKGKVRSTTVLSVSGDAHEALNEAAVRVVGQTYFSPARLDGEPIRMRFVIPVHIGTTTNASEH